MKPANTTLHFVCFFLLYMLSTLSGSAQTKDSLWILWTDESKSIISRFSLINQKLLERYEPTVINSDSLILLGKDLERHALRINSPKYESIALYTQAKGYHSGGDIEHAKTSYDSAIRIAEKIGYKSILDLCYPILCNLYIYNGEFEQAIHLINRALEFYTISNDMSGLAVCYNDLGLVYHFMDVHYLAQENYKKSSELYQILGNHYMVNVIQMRVAAEYIGEGKYLESLISFSGLLKYFKKIEDKPFFALTCENYSWLLKDLGYYDIAFKYLEESLDVYIALDDKRLIGRVKGNMGVLHHKMKNDKAAFEYINESLKIAYDEKDSNQVIISHYNLAQTHQDLNNYNESSIEYIKSLELTKQTDRLVDLPGLYMDLGNLNVDMENYITASAYYDSSYSIHKKNNDSLGLSKISISIGELYFIRKDYTNAISWCVEGFRKAALLRRILIEKDGCECLYKSYKAIGEVDLALFHFEQFTLLQDSLNSTEVDKKLQLLEFEYSYSADSLILAKDKLATELAFENKLTREKNTRNIIMFAGFGLLALAGTLWSRIVYIRRTNKTLKKKNKRIAEEKEKVEESEKEKEKFFNNVSHEFRTPLTLILGPLEDLVESHSDTVSIPNVEIMHRNAQHMKFMIDELLELSKIEFGNVRLKVKEENIVKLTEDHLHSFESLATKKEIKLRFRSEMAEYKVWLDEEKYRKIITNLLSNAFKFTQPGGKVVIEVSGIQTFWEAPAEADLQIRRKGIRVNISDNGIGIPEDKLPHIFNRFYQTEESPKSQFAGTGIGLALTKELVKLHHGSISVKSNPKSGTTFIVFIPLGTWHLDDLETNIEVEAVEEEINHTNEDKIWEVEKQIVSLQEKTKSKEESDLPIVLVTEDNPDMRFYIKSHLQKEFNILEAIDGEEGFKMAKEHIPDLIISDLMMPKMDGYELTKKLKSDERTSHIPIIILTAMASMDDKIDGLESGADAYVTKPFNSRELYIRVKNLIVQRQKIRERHARNLLTEQEHSPNNQNNSVQSIDQKFIQKAIQVVTEHISDQDFDASLFASEMALSRIQLHRKLKALTNKTTTEFIRTIRLNKAANLLKQKTGNVTEIAYDTGFSSLSWFAKTFKEQFGVSPSDYR